jgi:hypothetical protein
MATFTPQDVITEVRASIQDNVIPYRYSDTEVLRAVNHSLKRIALMRPDLFATTESFVCVAGALQTLPPECIRLIDVLKADSGASVNEVNRESLDLLYSSWQAGLTTTATDWMRNVRSPSQFFVYPPSPAGQGLLIQYSKSPVNYSLSAPIEILPDAYFPVVVDCVTWWMESFDAESVANKRAEMFAQSFRELLGFTAQVKPVTDTPEGGLTPQQVV